MTPLCAASTEGRTEVTEIDKGFFRKVLDQFRLRSRSCSHLSTTKRGSPERSQRFT